MCASSSAHEFAFAFPLYILVHWEKEFEHYRQWFYEMKWSYRRYISIYIFLILEDEWQTVWNIRRYRNESDAFLNILLKHRAIEIQDYRISIIKPIKKLRKSARSSSIPWQFPWNNKTFIISMLPLWIYSIREIMLLIFMDFKDRIQQLIP